MSDESIECAKGFFDWCDGVVAVNLVEIDVVGLQAPETGIDSIHDVSARGANVVAALAHTAIDLGGDDHVFASDVQIFQGLAEDFFAETFVINVGGVEEVDARVDRGLDERVGFGLVRGADHFPDTSVGVGSVLPAAEGHRAKTDSGNEKSGIA